MYLITYFKHKKKYLSTYLSTLYLSTAQLCLY